MRRLLVRLTFFAVALASAQGGLFAETHALLIGSGDYRSDQINDLEGPANDLAAMRRLVTDLGAANLVVLSDEEVTRTSVEQALFELGRKAAAGDWIVLYYSGHGAQALAPGDEGGEKLQFVPLPGFDPDRQDPKHFIVDKDFYAWLKTYVPRDVQILMIVDSCHSGTMQRAIRTELYGYTARNTLLRSGQPIELVPRPGPQFRTFDDVLPADDGIERTDLPNLIYFGASQDGQLALETALPSAGGESRGLLTYAFEQGLTRPGSQADRPASDLDNDGIVSVEEMAAYLNGQVHLLSSYRQDSSAIFPSEVGGQALLSETPSMLEEKSTPLPKLRIAPSLPTEDIQGGHPFEIVGSSASADFIWDRKDGLIFRRSGDLVAENARELSEVAGAIEKWQAMQALSPLVAERVIRLNVEPNGFDWLHFPGDRLKLSLERIPGADDAAIHATIFNIAPDGTVQLIYPLAGDAGIIPAGASGLDLLEVEVTPPFGAEHLVAVSTRGPAPYLRAALRSADGQKSAARIVRPIQEELRRAGDAGSIVIFELYTGQ